ncbi:hypothetical protein MKW92_016793 [Papaver armeniacum]|nr:hypothetical protein MKW92_016793 [Papaver armeniacum]
MFKPLVLFLLLQIMILLLSSSPAESATIEQGKPGCESKCGNITIPYPFGANDDCSYFNDAAGKLFYVHCNHSYKPPKAFLGMNDEKIEILSISDTEFRIKNNVIAARCYDDQTGKLVLDNPFFNLDFKNTPFTISYTKNMFVGIGCNLIAFANNQSRDCTSTCDTNADMIERSCNGRGCCQNSLPKGLNTFDGEVKRYYLGKSPFQSFSQCSFAFLVEKGQYTFKGSDLQLDGRLTKPDTVLPLVLDWSIAEHTCNDAQLRDDVYACKNNTVCLDAPYNPGYRCACDKGYEGNPYLGCKDINECEDQNNNPCYGTCTNTIGGYNCSACPEGSTGDGRKNGTSCTTVNKALPTQDGFPVIRVALGMLTA